MVDSSFLFYVLLCRFCTFTRRRTLLLLQLHRRSVLFILRQEFGERDIFPKGPFNDLFLSFLALRQFGFEFVQQPCLLPTQALVHADFNVVAGAEKLVQTRSGVTVFQFRNHIFAVGMRAIQWRVHITDDGGQQQEGRVAVQS